MDKTVLLICTGGTIAGRVATDERSAEAVQNCHRLLESVKPTLLTVEKKWGISLRIEPLTLCNLDSSDIRPSHWIDLAALIKKKYDGFDAVIITHGTNTLGYTSAALSFAFKNLDKPVIFTGSQVPLGWAGSDAATNLSNALRVAAWPQEESTIKGVLAVFGTYIISGTRVTKGTTFNYDAFRSSGPGVIGRIGRTISLDRRKLQKHVGYLSGPHYSRAKTAADLIFDNDFDMRIASLSEFPGMHPELITSIADNADIRGVILQAFGAGDASSHLRPAFEHLKDQEIPFVVATQSTYGISSFQVNEPGIALKTNNLAIPAYDMNIEAQTTKLAWLLAKMNRGVMNYESLCQEMVRDMRGEINVVWEIGI